MSRISLDISIKEGGILFTPFDHIFIECLDVGDTGIKTCTLNIGNELLHFSIGNYKMVDILYINGNTSIKPKCKTVPYIANVITIQLPLAVSQQTGGMKIRLLYGSPLKNDQAG